MMLMTVGYEGLTIEQFFSLLCENNVETLVDVRELPLSRKPGFSKTKLQELSEKHGIHYIHIRQLGSPRTIRHDYREHKDWRKFSSLFSHYLSRQDEALENLEQRIMTERCCLLCFEADHSVCHRSIVADKMSRDMDSVFQIKHLATTDQTRSASAHH